jgi:hypothetical protein
VLELSWYGTREVELPLGGAFHSKRLSLRSSQVGRLPAARVPRWSSRRRLETALALLQDARLDALVNEESPFHLLPASLRRLAADAGGVLCHRIRYEEP